MGGLESRALTRALEVRLDRKEMPGLEARSHARAADTERARVDDREYETLA